MLTSLYPKAKTEKNWTLTLYIECFGPNLISQELSTYSCRDLVKYIHNSLGLNLDFIYKYTSSSLKLIINLKYTTQGAKS